MNTCPERTDFPKYNLYFFDNTFCLFFSIQVRNQVSIHAIKKTASVHLIKTSSVYALGNYVEKLC